jgi:hypothetical protein
MYQIYQPFLSRLPLQHWKGFLKEQARRWRALAHPQTLQKHQVPLTMQEGLHPHHQQILCNYISVDIINNSKCVSFHTTKMQTFWCNDHDHDCSCAWCCANNDEGE